MGRRKWMGMIYQVGSDRQPGRLLRECRQESALWDGASKDVIADTGLRGRRDAVSRVLDLSDSKLSRRCQGANRSVCGCVNVE